MNMDNFLKKVGNNIKRIRKDIRQIKQKDLAFAVGLNVNTISNIENGKFPAQLDSIYKIAEYLNVEPVEFFKLSSIDIGTLNRITNLLNNLSQMNSDEIRKFLAKYDT